MWAQVFAHCPDPDTCVFLVLLENIYTTESQFLFHSTQILTLPPPTHFISCPNCAVQLVEGVYLTILAILRWGDVCFKLQHNSVFVFNSSVLTNCVRCPASSQTLQSHFMIVIVTCMITLPSPSDNGNYRICLTHCRIGQIGSPHQCMSIWTAKRLIEFSILWQIVASLFPTD